MKKIAFVALVMVVFSFIALGQSTLVPGDIAILGMNEDYPDALAFVFLVSVESGTQIIFTDCGWKDVELQFRTGEGAVVYTAPTALSAGTVVVYDSSTVMPEFADYTEGTVITPAGNFSLALAGDQIIAFQGSDATPSMIYAINNDTTGGVAWQTTATSSNSSALPTGLIDGTTAVAMFPELDNVVYNGITSGTKEELLAAIGNRANWIGSDLNRQTMPTGPFVITGVEGQPSITPVNFSLLPCLPNPANKSTKFSFSLSQNGKVELSVFNVLGQKVATLYKGSLASGKHTINWNLKDAQDRFLPNGVYFYQLTDGSRNSTRRLLILK